MVQLGGGRGVLPLYRGRSYLTISEEKTQELVNKLAGSGKILRSLKRNWTYRELNDALEYIGVAVSSGVETPTTKFIIHYSNKGTHIVPTIREFTKGAH